MRRFAILLSLTGLLMGLVGGSPVGRVAAQSEKISVSATVAAKPARIDLNRANRSELVRLPGMTQEVADRVIQNRPYRKLDELISKKVIGKKHFAQIREFVVIGPNGM